MRALLLARHLPREEQTSAHRQAARAMTRRFLESPLWERLGAADAVRVETPMTYVEAGGTVVRGTIDLVYRMEDGWHLVDYKTDRVRAGADTQRLAERYAPQVEAYADRWEQLTGTSVASARLWLADVGRAVPIR